MRIRSMEKLEKWLSTKKKPSMATGNGPGSKGERSEERSGR